jgi:hypothetical protein
MAARRSSSIPIVLFVPSLAIATLVLCANFIADGLRDALDPRTRAAAPETVFPAALSVSYHRRRRGGGQRSSAKRSDRSTRNGAVSSRVKGVATSAGTRPCAASAARSLGSSVQALRHAVREPGKRPALPRVRPVPHQPPHLRRLHPRARETAGRGRGGGHVPLCRCPRLDGPGGDRRRGGVPQALGPFLRRGCRRGRRPERHRRQVRRRRARRALHSGLRG